VVCELQAPKTVANAYRLPGGIGRELEERMDFVVGHPTRAQRTRSTQYSRSQLLHLCGKSQKSSTRSINKKKDNMHAAMRKKSSNVEGSDVGDSQHSTGGYCFTDKDQLPELSIELDVRLFPWLSLLLVFTRCCMLLLRGFTCHFLHCSHFSNGGSSPASSTDLLLLGPCPGHTSCR